ncbi:MAG: hypothetical protein M3R26_00120 [Actinomycetota bacterium]|nr:hypothetical protein [Actinomycetota bacterium]MDQ2980720.1 hypothetical protein [Actinomycetota bacterium]
MTRKHAVVAAVGLALFGGCQSSNPAANASSADVKAALARGVAQIRGSHDKEKLHAKLLHTLARLRSVRASTPVGREARSLAIQGFASMLRGVESQLAFIQNDSGNVEAATRDARRADRSLKRGASLLRAAGRALGVQVGSLNGY